MRPRRWCIDLVGAAWTTARRCPASTWTSTREAARRRNRLAVPAPAVDPARRVCSRRWSGSSAWPRRSPWSCDPPRTSARAASSELREQTVRLLNFAAVPAETFGRQLAFNIVPQTRLLGDGPRLETTDRSRRGRAVLGWERGAPRRAPARRAGVLRALPAAARPFRRRRDGGAGRGGAAPSVRHRCPRRRGGTATPMDVSGERTTSVYEIAEDGVGRLLAPGRGRRGGAERGRARGAPRRCAARPVSLRRRRPGWIDGGCDAESSARRWLSAWLLLCAVIGAAAQEPVPAPEGGAAAAVAAEIDVERTLLAEDLDRYDRLVPQARLLASRLAEIYRTLGRGGPFGSGRHARAGGRLARAAGPDRGGAGRVARRRRSRWSSTSATGGAGSCCSWSRWSCWRAARGSEAGALTGTWDVVLMPLEQRGAVRPAPEPGRWSAAPTSSTAVGREACRARWSTARCSWCASTRSWAGSMELEGFLSGEETGVRGTWLNYELAGGDGASGHWSAAQARRSRRA